VRVVTVAGAEAVVVVDELADELADAVALFFDADRPGSLPWAIWIARPPVSARAAATARAVIFAVSAVMAGTLTGVPQRKLGTR
jgi:hypothetical protein